MGKFNSLLTILVIAITLSFNQGCTSTDSGELITANSWEEFAAKYGPTPYYFTINASLGDTIETPKGTKIFIKPNAFIRADGSLPTGTVSIAFTEIKNVFEMILADKPTITDDGEMLESFGEFLMIAKENNTGLKINLAEDSAALRIMTSFRPSRPVLIDAGSAKLWDSDTTTVLKKTTGLNSNGVLVTITIPLYSFPGISWNTPTPLQISHNNDSLIFLLKKTNRWTNCDALSHIPADTKTSVLCYFNNHFNPDFAANGNTGLIGKSIVFLKPKNINTTIKFYNPILEPIAGKEGFHSYIDKIPVGMEAAFIAFSEKDGKFYAQTKEVIIANDPGKSFMGIDFNLTEVSATQLLNMLQYISDY